MKNKRHTDFYMPVLKVLEDMKLHEINQLMEEVADLCQLSEEDRNIMTRGGTNKKYRSHIQWAVTDLYQAGFIERPERGLNKISFDGMLMLEENPENPKRDYLYKKSEKFRDFVNRKGTRNKHNGDSDLFEGETYDVTPQDGTKPHKEDITKKAQSNEEIQKELKTLFDLRNKMKELSFNTKEIDEKIEKLKSIELEGEIVPILSEMLTKLPSSNSLKYVVMIDMASIDKPTAYICKDKKKIDLLFSQSGQIFVNANEVVTLKSNKNKTATSSNQIKDRNTRRQSALLKVTFSDGTVYDSKYASDNFAKSIEKMGASNVAALGYKTSGMPLVGLTRPEKYNCQKLESGYYVSTNIPNDRKKYYMEAIAKDLGIEIQVMLID